MAKYFIILILLACLALENKNIYNRLHARSHPSSRGDILRPNPKHQPHPHVQHTSQQLQQEHHIRQQRSRQIKHLEPDPTSEEDEAPITKQEYYARLRLHAIHKREQQLKQELSYNHHGEQLKVPRLWQHLMEEEEKSHRQQNPVESEDYPRMFGDAPEESYLPSEEQLDLSPLDFVRNELMAEEQKRDQELEPEQDEDPVVPPMVNEAELMEKNITISVKSSGGGGGCPKCESSRQVEHITEEQLTHLRIEFVKQQILEKLRLKESPNVSAVELPKPIFDGVSLSHPDDSSKKKELDDYYARTSKKFILLKREEVECNRLSGKPSMCFSFKIDDAEGFDVSTAVLWLFKNKQNRTTTISQDESSLNSTSSRQTIVVSEVEVEKQKDSKYLPVAKTIALQAVNEQDEWMKIDIEWPIKRWIGDHDLSHLIQITCTGCEVGDMEEIISVDKDYRPFIMIDMQNRRRKSRQKRSVNCSSGMTECCREHLYISFKEIGWSNWILKPDGYNAYFCRGSCSSVASVTQAASHHSSLMKILSTSGANKSLELVPCCTAKQYSSLQLVVMDSSSSATVKTLPNMVVESCGCR
ncbi:growth/differentiation factor 8 [Drosophila kikkawai]|uniref:Growth/differentiation factor 8 n=1 Tax=Drosophila kikkawai TaxID=30033 RepID=A0A6P4INK6_DROKI|nr:growth/differentiation factor 8 [Drosophila kikkawai]XP_017024078.1 growth/differentiation factor 8 [Drosophila kikkawai]